MRSTRIQRQLPFNGIAFKCTIGFKLNRFIHIHGEAFRDCLRGIQSGQSSFGRRGNVTSGVIVIVVVVGGIRLIATFSSTFSGISGVAETATPGVVSIWMDRTLSLVIQGLSLKFVLRLPLKGREFDLEAGKWPVLFHPLERLLRRCSMAFSTALACSGK